LLQAAEETDTVKRVVRSAQYGNRDALAFLYARYADDICAYLVSLVGDEHEAEDLTQQVFAKLMRVIGKYQARPDVPFRGWLMRVARNIAFDHMRGQRAVPYAEVRTASEEASGTVGAGSSSTGAAEWSRELREALAALPEDQREVLVLRHLAGLSPGEIALRTGRSEGSIHGLHHRGRRALQADLRSRGLAPVTALDA
jgi:RNA polymerase sigma-70 factor (ECF subfamily)